MGKTQRQKFQEFEDQDNAENRRRAEFDLRKRAEREKDLEDINCKLAALYTEIAGLRTHVYETGEPTRSNSCLPAHSNRNAKASSVSNTSLHGNGIDSAKLMSRYDSTRKSITRAEPEVNPANISFANLYDSPPRPAVPDFVISLPGNPSFVRRKDGIWVELRCPVCGTNKAVSGRMFQSWVVFWDHLHQCHGETLPGIGNQRLHNIIERCTYRIVEADEIARRYEATALFSPKQSCHLKRGSDNWEQSASKRQHLNDRERSITYESRTQQPASIKAEMSAVCKNSVDPGIRRYGHNLYQ